MWGKKKKQDEKNQTREYVNGKLVPQTVPELKVPIPPPEETIQANVPFQGDCIICFDYGFYADNVGVWHHCPRCNPKPTLTVDNNQIVQKSDPKPKSALYEFRICENCGAKNEVHKKKKAFKCVKCGEAST